MSKPYLAFSELTKRVYIVHTKGKEDVTDWVSTYAQQKLNKHGVMESLPLDESSKYDDHDNCKSCGARKPF